MTTPAAARLTPTHPLAVTQIDRATPKTEPGRSWLNGAAAALRDAWKAQIGRHNRLRHTDLDDQDSLGNRQRGRGRAGIAVLGEAAGAP